jgi:hypothetical protein
LNSNNGIEFIFVSNLFELLQFSEDLNYLNGFKLNLIEIWKPQLSHGPTPTATSAWSSYWAGVARAGMAQVGSPAVK